MKVQLSEAAWRDLASRVTNYFKANSGIFHPEIAGRAQGKIDLLNAKEFLATELGRYSGIRGSEPSIEEFVAFINKKFDADFKLAEPKPQQIVDIIRELVANVPGDREEKIALLKDAMKKPLDVSAYSDTMTSSADLQSWRNRFYAAAIAAVATTEDGNVPADAKLGTYWQIGKKQPMTPAEKDRWITSMAQGAVAAGAIVPAKGDAESDREYGRNSVTRRPQAGASKSASARDRADKMEVMLKSKGIDGGLARDIADTFLAYGDKQHAGAAAEMVIQKLKDPKQIKAFIEVLTVLNAEG